MVNALYAAGVLCTVLAGVALAVQTGTNATLAAVAGSRPFSAVVSFAVGTAACAVYFAVDCLALRHAPPTAPGIAAAPWWSWAGGLLGAYYVVVVIIFAQALGAGTLVSVFVTAQLATSVALDLAGLAGFSRRAVSWPRLLGVGLMVAGVVLVTRWPGALLAPSELQLRGASVSGESRRTLLAPSAVQLAGGGGSSSGGARGAAQLLTRAAPPPVPHFMGANAYWMPSSAAAGDTGAVDSVLDGLQRLGLTVVRTWAFGDGFPAAPGEYDEAQARRRRRRGSAGGRGLDYVVAGAARRGLRVVLALGNFWPAYVGPERWLAWAEGSAEGKTVADFYASGRAAALFEAHMRSVTARVSTVSGVALRDEPAVMGYDILNEPRCPGCDARGIAARDAWLRRMVEALRAAAPGQLIFSGTEGYFAPGDPRAAYNPGAGGQCEGEHWSQEVAYADVATVHIYYRRARPMGQQLESLAHLGWSKPGFDAYAAFLAAKLRLYDDDARAAGKELVIEEVVFAIVGAALVAAKQRGGNLRGALIWNAAHPGQPDVGGYNVDVTRPPSAGAAASLGARLRGGGGGGGGGSGPRPSPRPSPSPQFGRRLAQLVVTPGDDVLDAFRRGPAREACAAAAAGSWALAPDARGGGPDVGALRAAVAGVDVVDVIAQVTRALAA
ncbi:MAN4 [Scenedesmus sp. PABB004]|nr:MAN4 [Scenedesmus sp. PABB004]